MGVTPKSPKRVTNTLASVPAPFTSPVTATTSYTEREMRLEIRGGERRHAHYGNEAFRERKHKFYYI